MHRDFSHSNGIYHSFPAFIAKWCKNENKLKQVKILFKVSLNRKLTLCQMKNIYYKHLDF